MSPPLVPATAGTDLTPPLAPEPDRDRDLDLDARLTVAGGTAAGRRLAGAFCEPADAFALLSPAALHRLADDEPVDPNDPDTWRNVDAHAQAILHRHGITGAPATRLELNAVRVLIAAQAHADRDAGVDGTAADGEPSVAALARAHAALPIDLDDPRVWAAPRDQRRALARRAGITEPQGEDVADWVLTDPARSSR